MPKQRGHNEGSIYKRQDGLWCASVTVGRDPTGKILRRTVYAQTRREVAAKLNELLNDKGHGLPLANLKRQTVQQYLEHWLETSVKTSCRPNTYANYGYSVNGHILPALGSLQLSKLGPQHIQRLLADMQSKGLTRMTTLTYAVLHRALEQACKWRLIPSNPCSVVDAPRVASKDIAVLSADEAARFLRAAKEDRYYALYFLALATAARQGELLGLKWTDIDLKEGTLAIARQLQWLKGGPVLAEVKTAESRRTLPLPASSLVVLHEHKKAQAAARLAAGPLWQDIGLVFTTAVGGPVSPSGVRNRSFYAILAKAGLPRITFHGLRHTAATLLLSRGASVKHIQSQLGHSRINVTLDIYAHVLPDMKKEAARIMDGFLSKL